MSMTNRSKEPKKDRHMYQLNYEDLFDERYDLRFDEDEGHIYADSAISSLIEHLYCSQTLDKPGIALSLSSLVKEITPSADPRDDKFAWCHINLKYVPEEVSFEKSFGVWLDCIDPLTGELNYNKLIDPERQFFKKEIKHPESMFDAVNTLVAQITTLCPFDDSALSGALIYLAKKYGVEYKEAAIYTSNVTRN